MGEGRDQLLDIKDYSIKATDIGEGLKKWNGVSIQNYFVAAVRKLSMFQCSRLVVQSAMLIIPIGVQQGGVSGVCVAPTIRVRDLPDGQS